MCGRFVQSKAWREYQRYLRAVQRGKEPEERLSWNVAPSTSALVARRDEGELVLERMTWGLEGISRPLSNARIETAADKSSFREAWRKSRCIVPVDGWYEWQANFGEMKPFYFALPSEPTLLAGLFRDGRFTLITAETRGPLRSVHTRRPVAIPLERVNAWCDPNIAWTTEELEQTLVPETAFGQVPVSSAVNGTRNDGPHLIERRKLELSQIALKL